MISDAIAFGFALLGFGGGVFAVVAWLTDRAYRDFTHYAPDDVADQPFHNREDIARRAMAHGQSEAAE